MSASVLYMSMSLDGYIAGPNDEPGNSGGDGFMRLHEWYFTGGQSGRPPGPAAEVADQLNPAKPKQKAAGGRAHPSGRVRPPAKC